VKSRIETKSLVSPKIEMKRNSAPGGIQKQVEVLNQLGLHLKAAGLLAQEANKYPADIFISKDGLQANAKSIFGVAMLAAGQGSIVVITAEGERAEEALENIERLFLNKFNEV